MEISHSKIRNSYNTILKMMKKRGFKFETEPFTEKTFSQQWEGWTPQDIRESLYLIFDAVEKSPAILNLNKHLVLWSPWSKVGVGEIRSLSEKIKELCPDAKNIIFIVQDDLTSAAVKTLEILPSTINIVISIFKEDELQVDITEHEKAFPHRICTPKETREILEKYKTERPLLPHIPPEDPMRRYLGAPKGALIEIKRLDEKKGTYNLYYRYCI